MAFITPAVEHWLNEKWLIRSTMRDRSGFQISLLHWIKRITCPKCGTLLEAFRGCWRLLFVPSHKKKNTLLTVIKEQREL